MKEVKVFCVKEIKTVLNKDSKPFRRKGLQSFSFSLVVIFILGFFDSYKQYKEEKEEYNRRKDHQRRHYRAQRF